jgi:peptide/nickel transport system ATP-binding protein
MSTNTKPLLRVEDLCIEFATEEGPVRAVRGVDLTIDEGESVGLVGESGCGKTVTALSLMQLVPRPRGRITRGAISLWRNGEVIDLVKLAFDSQAIREIRGRDLAMVFQEPMTSLNPSFTIGFQIVEAIALHQKIAKRDLRRAAIDSLSMVSIPDPSDVIDRYPHELSGGMRQRTMIAMAMACAPRLLIADEPTTALDVTVQAQILDLMKQYKKKRNMSMLWITHDLGVVGELCDRVVVMYLGQVVESNTVSGVFREPRHPYTQGLLRCLPLVGADEGQDLAQIPGNVPKPTDAPPGCAFEPRCPKAFARCRQAPGLIDVGGCLVRCWLYERSESVTHV